MVEMKEQLNVTDMKGNKIGVMNIEVSWHLFCETQDKIVFEICANRWRHVTAAEENTTRLMTCLWIHQMNWLGKRSTLFSRLSTAGG